MSTKAHIGLIAAAFLAWLPSAQAQDSIDASGQQTVVLDRPVASVYAKDSAKVILKKGAQVVHFLARDDAEVTIEGGAEVTFMEFMGRRLTVKDGRFHYFSIYEHAEAHIHRIEISSDVACAAGVGDWGGRFAYTPGTRIHLYADVLAFNAGVIEGVWKDGSSFSLSIMQQESDRRPICKRPQSMPTQWVVHEIPGPSFDCAKASRRAERLVCATPALAKLDKELARDYRQARSATQDVEALAREQRRWLARRDRCSDVGCLRASYEDRARAIAGSGMTNDRARALCETVVDSINDGSIRSKFATFSHDEKLEQRDSHDLQLQGLSITGVLKVRYKGRDRRFISIYGGGTCPTCSIFDADAKEPVLEPPDDGDRLRWAGWGSCDQLMWVDREAIVVTGQFGDENIRATLVSWIDPKGTVRPLCYLKQTGEAETRIAVNENERLCRAVLDGRAEAPEWHYISIDRNSPGFGRFGARDGEATALDLDRDGTLDYIGRFGYDSGGGCGGHFEWFDHVAKTGTGSDDGDYVIQASALGKWLRELPGGGLLESVPGTPVKMGLLTYEGKPYVLTGGYGLTAQVLSFWGGSSKTWCGFRVLPKHAIEVFYPIETWPKASDQR